MEEFLAEQEQYRGHAIKIYQDCDPQSPREWDNFGTMVCFHKRYTLGDSGHGINHDDFGSWSEIEGYLQKERDVAVMLPLYLYDHSGITMNTRGFSCPWDSGRVGIIYATRQNIRDNYNVKRVTSAILEKAKDLLEYEVKEYDLYLTGQVYGYRIEDADGEDVDSCWGYYDEPSGVIKECRSIIDHIVDKADNRHYPKIEVFATKGNQFRARIRESITEPSYEVTVGSESWGAGKGIIHKERIQHEALHIINCLLNNYKQHFEGNNV
jgi:hypothetical protein